MKLIDVSVEGCGRFGTPSRIAALGPGVNILAARNEAGKSTLFRAIRTCLFERHSAAGREIAALATEGLSLPVTIAVGFEHGGHIYEIRKSFLKSKQASLRCDGREIARNAEADERVWDLLGIAPRSTRSLDEAAFGLLWVGQGHSFTAPQPSEGARSVLNQVIQQEVGTLVGGERARAVLAQVRDELSKLVTDTGRPRAGGPFEQAQGEAARLTDERLAVGAKLAALDQSLDELARLRAELKTLSDPARQQQAKLDLDETRRLLQAAQEAAGVVKRREQDELLALTLLQEHVKKRDSLADRARDIDRNRSRIKELHGRIQTLDEQAAPAAQALSEAQARRSALDAELKGIEDEDRRLRSLRALAQRAAARDEQSRRLDRLQDFERRMGETQRALKANAIDDAAIRDLEAIETLSALAAARREAGAARLVVERRDDATVSVNGEPVGTSLARAVTEPLVIAVGPHVTITLTPPALSLAETEAEERSGRDRLRALLAAHDAGSADDLRRRRRERLAHEETARGLEIERAMLLPRTAVVAAEIARLVSEIAETDAAARSLSEALGVDALPSPEALDLGAEAIQERRIRLGEERAALDGRIGIHNQALTDMARERAMLSGQAGEIDAQLRADLAVLPDERRESLLADCVRAVEEKASDHRAKAALLGEGRATAPGADEVERLRNRADRLAAAHDNRAQQSQELRQKIAHLEGQVLAAGGDGLGERAASLAAEQAMALAERDRHAERVAVLGLLRDAVEHSYEKRREQLNAPLRRHLRPFLNDVFPQAEIDLGEDFRVAGLKRSGPASELFGQLSHGTQEQIAVLIRLAMGAMIAEKGPDVPIILDDALVFSDDERIEAMFDAINRAGRNQQVIVLTCRSRSFASLGGRQISIV